MLEKKNFYINGSWVAPKNPKDIEVINPATEKSCAVISLGSKEDVNDAVIAAKEAFKRIQTDFLKFDIEQAQGSNFNFIDNEVDINALAERNFKSIYNY